MKFINYLESITGVGIFPLLSLLIFFVFFVMVTLWVVRAPKNYINELKNLPLDDIEKTTEQENENVNLTDKK
jgi:cytochrome c oxidase cbb3-type subunit 4